MMKGIFTLLFFVAFIVGYSQTLTPPPVNGVTSGDYYSGRSGLWSDAGSWYIWNGTTWNTAVTAPTNAAGVITVGSAHVMTVAAPGTTIVDQVVVVAGGKILIDGATTVSTFRINRSLAGAQDLIVSGEVEVRNGILLINNVPSAVVRVASGGILTNTSGLISNGSITKLLFDGGSLFELKNFQQTVPSASWNIASTCKISADVPGGAINLGQTFGNFEWNTTTLSGDLDLAGALTNVQGNLNFTNTGGSLVYLGYSNPYTLNVGGNATFAASAQVVLAGEVNSTLSITGALTSQASLFRGSDDVGVATVNVAGATNLTGGTFDAGSSTGSTVFNLSGDYTNSGASIIRSGSPATGMSVNFVGAGVQNYTSTQVPTFPVNYATSSTSNLTIGATSFLAGTGSLTIGATSRITLLSTIATGALQANTTGGNVRVSGTRTYNGTIVYGGAARQYMATSHPGTANTIIANTGDVTMLGSVAFTTGTLSLNSGLLRIENASTLTVATVGNNGGSLGINGNSSLVINGSGSYGNLALTHLAGTSMRNLTINRSSGSVTQATASLTVSGATTLSQGTLALLAGTTTVINGPFSAPSGAITSVSTARLTIGGSGVMPAGISITGVMNILQMNRAGGNLNLTNASPNNLDLTRLNLYGGSVTNGGGLRMANSSTIYRTNGALTNAIGAVGVYNVQYTNFAAADLPIGFEIPSSGSALNNFAINNTASGTHNVSLNRILRVAGGINVTRGGLVTNNNDVFVARNFAIAAAGRFTPGSSTITFNGSVAQTFGGPIAYTINNLIIAKSARSNFTLSSPVNIQTSFAITTNRCAANVGTNRLTLLSTATTTAYIPTLFSDGTGNSTITGTVIVQRQLPNSSATRAYRYITPTVTNSTVADWQAEFPISGTFSNPSTGSFGGVNIVSANPSLYYYDQTLVTGSSPLGSGYVAYPSSGNSSAAPLVSGRGYAAFIRTKNPLTYDTRGTLGQNNINVACTFSGGTNGGWNLIGNPYPAPVDWDIATTQRTGGVGSAIYFTDNTNSAGAGTGVTVSYVPGVGGTGTFDGVLASGQAFWVHASSAGSVRFRENQKFSGQTEFIREASPENLLRIKMTTGAVQDNILVHIGDSATFEFDQKYDAYKFDPYGVNISTLSSSNDRLSINSVGRSDCNSVIPFDIKDAVAGSYTLDFTGLETFTAQVTPVLYDKVLDKRIDIASTPSYNFSVADTSTLRRRFELLFDAPAVQTSVDLAADDICEGNTVGYVALSTSQVDVKYKAVLNGVTVSTEVSGTGAPLQIPIEVSALVDGDNELTISAQRLTCDPKMLDKKVTVTVVRKGAITDTKAGTVCGSGTASLSATGTNAATFNWYEDLQDATPILDQHGSNFVTPVLNKTKTYYVAAVNSKGCEGERVAVMANVTNILPAVITAQGTRLTSNYEKGNQWYVDAQPIPGATSQTIEITSSGLYTVVATVDNCSTTSEGREMLITELEETSGVAVRVYPNPASDKIKVEVRTKNEVEATLITQTGVLVNNIKLSGTQDVQSGEFVLGSLPDGVYFIRITDGSKVYTKKISKIK